MADPVLPGPFLPDGKKEAVSCRDTYTLSFKNLTNMSNLRQVREGRFEWKTGFNEKSLRMLHYRTPKRFSTQTSDGSSGTFLGGGEGRYQVRQRLSSCSQVRASPRIWGRLSPPAPRPALSPPRTELMCLRQGECHWRGSESRDRSHFLNVLRAMGSECHHLQGQGQCSEHTPHRCCD